VVGSARTGWEIKGFKVSSISPLLDARYDADYNLEYSVKLDYVSILPLGDTTSVNQSLVYPNLQNLSKKTIAECKEQLKAECLETIKILEKGEWVFDTTDGLHNKLHSTDKPYEKGDTLYWYRSCFLPEVDVCVGTVKDIFVSCRDVQIDCFHTNKFKKSYRYEMDGKNYVTGEEDNYADANYNWYSLGMNYVVTRSIQELKRILGTQILDFYSRIQKVNSAYELGLDENRLKMYDRGDYYGYYIKENRKFE